MADTKDGRDKQARDEENRQRQREITEALERADETEPPVDEAEFDTLETELESTEFPMTALEVVEAVGYHEIESTDGTYTVAEMLPRTEDEMFDSPDEIRIRIQRPSIAAAMKRIIEASERLQNVEFSSSQREAYEKTLRKLKAVTGDDEDEGIPVVTDWIVEQITEKEKLPGSRDVRKRAAKFCRNNGYEIRNDEWLGV